MRMHPGFLLGAAKSYPDDPGARAVDPLDNGGILLVRQVPERRREGACDVQIRETHAQRFLKAGKAGGAAAIKKDLFSGLGSALAGFQHQVRPADALLIGMPFPLEDRKSVV